ncbi:hypothetical protein DFH07DRAFT_731535 [Mycena maculata]|uniref:Uncharacterized protein n=1 Tax=Mycena maculata TaxID=230809 RepID=A0AAD7K220_9AGAR|nr:hypothetical protein DFH07DRAFT_731535 [Mycena maculata]
MTPTRRRPRDDDNELENIDPALLSPSKRVRTLYAHLGRSSAASLLLSSPKIKSYNNPILTPVVQHVPHAIPTPDWSLSTPGSRKDTYKTRGQLEAQIAELQNQLALAQQNVHVRDQIIEEANATMVYQNMGLRKMNQALFQQEEKAATDRARLFKGKAQCLSADEFFDALKEIQANWTAKEARKEAKKAERQRKKEAREEIEKEWAEMKWKHAVLVEAWEAECAGLVEMGTRKKDLPPKPKLGKKPQLPAVDDEEEEEEEEPIDETDV